MHQNQNQNTNKHLPVLLEQTLAYLSPQEGNSYLDLTAGYGGHAGAVLELTKNPKQTVLVDRDQNAVDELKKKFSGSSVKIMHNDFFTASKLLVEENMRFDVILADLGVSSPHFDTASRGFAIALDGPLDMRMDQRQSLTAKDIVNTYSESDLRDLLRVYGEEPRAARVANAIVHARPITTTKQLATIVMSALPRGSKIHPATRTFQGLRIATNDELGLLSQSLPLWFDLLNPGGRIAVISFHSLEDRIVKRVFSELGGNTYDATIQLLTKRPAVADHTELVFNPRARSAKLRAAVKIKK